MSDDPGNRSDVVVAIYDRLISGLAQLLDEVSRDFPEDPHLELSNDLTLYAIDKRLARDRGTTPEIRKDNAVLQAAIDLISGLGKG